MFFKHRTIIGIIIEQMNFLLSLILLIQQSSLTVKAAEWSHDRQNLWAQTDATCGGINQSPISINTRDAVANDSLEIELINYIQPTISFKVKNNGHTVTFDYIGDKASMPTISGNALNGEQFVLSGFHFHWGNSNVGGAEHLINNRQYDVEMHLVHFNRKFSSLERALDANDGSVAVLGIFLKILRHNEEFEPIVDAVSDVKQTREIKHVEDPITLRNLLPKTIGTFFRYHGSLTTPPCTENIIWLLLKEPVEIGQAQYNAFLQVMNLNENKKLLNNNRAIQALNGRKIEISTRTGKGTSKRRPSPPKRPMKQADCYETNECYHRKNAIVNCKCQICPDNGKNRHSSCQRLNKPETYFNNNNRNDFKYNNYYDNERSYSQYPNTGSNNDRTLLTNFNYYY